MRYLQISFLMLLLPLFFNCKKGGGGDPGTTGIVPANLVVAAVVAKDNSGNVAFTASANNAATYDYDFGNGIYQTVPSGVVNYKYPVSGTYTVTVIAKSKGGQTLSKSVEVLVSITTSVLWSDEFNTDGAPDAKNWGYDLGTGDNGWGNSELQYYTNRAENAYISNGTLKIVLKKESYSGSAYTSARLLSKGKFSFKYGRLEIRAKLTTGGGTWPALWLLGDNFSTAGWPACGEIDMMEYKGNEVNRIFGTLHYPGHSGGGGVGSSMVITNAATEFHRYALDWSPASIKIMVDDVVFYTFANTGSTPFNQNFFVILNLAMGGTFGGAADPNVSSAVMEVDYVRVTQ